uniref:C2H2-type domain-containing protein n=1 Tax=Lutzomyia longipalpis TaxID=7200 RepID=A0A1B0GHF4_LUTLO
MESDDSREIVVQASIFEGDAVESGDDLDEEIPAVMFTCQYCEKYFKSRETYEIHSQMHVDRNLRRCDYCENWYHTDEQLEIHLRDHLDMKPFFCRVCGDRFSNQHGLEHHLQLHGGIKLFRCVFCFEMFSVLDQLNNHLVLHAPPSVYKFQEVTEETPEVSKEADVPRECQKIPPILPVVVEGAEEERPTSPDHATKRLMAKLPKLAPKDGDRPPPRASKVIAKTPPKSNISQTKDPPRGGPRDRNSPTTSAPANNRRQKPVEDTDSTGRCRNCGIHFATAKKLRVHLRQCRHSKNICRAKR